LFGIVISSAGVLAVPAIVGAASNPNSNICSKVSDSSIDAIVGYEIAASEFTSQPFPASTSNGGVSTVDNSCAYAPSNPSNKIVNLHVQTTSKPIMASGLKKLIGTENGGGSKITTDSYPGFGHPAEYALINSYGSYSQEIDIINGKTIYSANIGGKTLSKAKLASLARLAEKL
jgi:hypothetical protein